MQTATNIADIARRRGPWPLSATLALASARAPGRVADAHGAVQAQPGDLTVPGNVPIRPACGSAPARMAMMASPSRRCRIAPAR